MNTTDTTNGGIISRWRFFTSFITLIIAFSLPLEQMAFHANLSHPILFFLRWIGYLVFACDVFIRFRNGEYDPKKSGRVWMVIDVAAALPIGPILFWFFSGTPMWLLSIAHLIPIVRLSRVYTEARHWQQLKPSQTGIRRVATTLVFIALLIHWIGCWQLAVYNQDPEADFVLRYTQAVYWTITTMTTIGYGDITPDKHQPRQLMFTMLIMIIGAGAFGFIIGNIATIMSNLDFARNQYLDKMQRITAFMRYNEIPDQISRQVQDYHSHLWRTRRGFNESEILADLPPSLRIEVEMHLRRDIVAKVPFFKDADSTMIRALVAQLKPRIAMAGEYIIRKGDIGESMFFIANGTVEVLAADSKTPVATLTDGSFFGEIALLERKSRSADVLAVTYCDLYTLDTDALDRVAERYPAFGEHIRSMAEQRKSWQ